MKRDSSHYLPPFLVLTGLLSLLPVHGRAQSEPPDPHGVPIACEDSSGKIVPCEDTTSNSDNSNRPHTWGETPEGRLWKWLKGRNERKNQQKAHDLNHSGVEAFGQDRLDEALRLFQEALRYAPDNIVMRANSLHTQARLAYKAGDVGKARNLLEEAVRVNPNAQGPAGDLRYLKDRVSSQEREQQIRDQQARDADAAKRDADAARHRIQAILNGAQVDTTDKGRTASGASNSGLTFMGANSSSQSKNTSKGAASPSSSELRFMGLTPFPAGNPRDAKQSLTLGDADQIGKPVAPNKLAGAQLRSAAKDGPTAKTLSGERASEKARRVFDDKRATPAGTLETPVVDGRNPGRQAVIPPALAARPAYRELVKQKQESEKKYRDLETRLNAIRQQQASGQGNTSELAVQGAQLKQQMSIVKSQIQTAQVKMDDLRVKFEEEPTTPKPKSGITQSGPPKSH